VLNFFYRKQYNQQSWNYKICKINSHDIQYIYIHIHSNITIFTTCMKSIHNIASIHNIISIQVQSEHICRHWRLEPKITAVQASSGVIKMLLMKSFVGLSETTCERYKISKWVDRKIQNKIKKIRSESVKIRSESIVHFLPTPISLMKEWHQMMMILKIKKVSTI
jgi:hypothetical protein